MMIAGVVVAASLFASSTLGISVSRTASSGPGGEPGPFGLRILFESNQTPVSGAQVIATNRPGVYGCVGSPGYPLTNQTTVTFTTNKTMWYMFDSGYDESYSITVTYSGESYNLTVTFSGRSMRPVRHSY